MKPEALGAVLCVMLVALPIGLLIGAAILRAAVSLANKCLPAPVARDEWDEWDEDEERPRRRRRGGGTAIPEPALGKAMGIVFVNFLAGLIVSVPINLAPASGSAASAGAAGRTRRWRSSRRSSNCRSAS